MVFDHVVAIPALSQSSDHVFFFSSLFFQNKFKQNRFQSNLRNNFISSSAESSEEILISSIQNKLSQNKKFFKEQGLSW